LPPPEQSLARAIAYGVVRDRRLLEWLGSRLLQKPLKDEAEVHALLLCGLYQLRSMRVPPHAAVGETVGAADPLGKSWAKGLLNAVLRRYQRERQALEAAAPIKAAERLSYPDWLAGRLQQDWSERWRGILAAGNQPGPLTLRVNRRRGGRDAYLRELAGAGIEAAPVAAAENAVRLVQALPVERLPGFAEGRVSVQDASPQLAAGLLRAQPGQRVLDACSAPGGKTAHLLERVDDLKLLALDIDAERLARVRATLDRLQLHAELRAADAAQPAGWWDGRPFDRILLDAPCSGTGVIRRHPDIKWLRRDRDIAAMSGLQRRLLDALWPLLATDGVLLYATCSILGAEGADVVSGFIDAHPEAHEDVIDTDWGEACRTGRRIAPGGDFDGFYYARLRKAANG
jgi:16S rRNA (cytosine967-C5)-methyltransferase